VSLGSYSIFPFLKGWEWNIRTYTFNPKKSEGTNYEISNNGWLQLIVVTCDDCFAEVEMHFKGSSKTTETSKYSVFPQYLYSGGAIGEIGLFSSLTRYLRTSPTSTAGLYVYTLYCGIGNSETLPMLYKSIIKTNLLSNSTQQTSTIIVGFATIDIVDSELFIKSVRAFEGNRNMVIDKALLDYGNTDFGVNK
jgi:hypothetical protein